MAKNHVISKSVLYWGCVIKGLKSTSTKILTFLSSRLDSDGHDQTVLKSVVTSVQISHMSLHCQTVDSV